MNLSDLRALLSVVELGSFQAAARALAVPRTSLRRRVDRLEEVVGAPLLTRETSGARLTRAGEAMVQRAGPLLTAASTMVDEARSAEGAILGTLRMIVPVGTPVVARVQALRSLEALHPGIVLDVAEADDPLTMLRSPFDLLLHLGPSAEREGWYSRVLMRFPVTLWASAAYLAREGTPTALDELGLHRLLTFRVAGRYADAWPLTDGGTVAISPSVVSANPELLVTLAAQDGGIALLPNLLGLFRPRGLELVPVLDGVVGDELALRVLTPRASGVDPRLRALIDNAQLQLERAGMVQGTPVTHPPTAASSRAL